MFNDPDYLRRAQYADARHLDARARLHRKYGRDDWYPWAAGQVSWSEGDRVLEVGCGPGWFWAAAADVLPARLDLTLTDLSAGMVETACARAAEAGPDWAVEGRALDATRLPFADASFDVVMACHMLYHVPDPALAIAELARVLRPGGVALVTTNGRGHLRELARIEASVWPGSAEAGAAELFGLENGLALLERAFGQVALHRHHDDLDCTDPVDVAAYLRSSPPGIDATADEACALAAEIGRAFQDGGGRLRIGKEAGAFVCAAPRRVL